MTTELFRPGTNIAMNVPPAKFLATVKFYTEILGFESIATDNPNTVGIKYGSMNLWIDANDKVTEKEIFFEISVTDITQAKAQLSAKGIEVCDNPFETLPEGYRGFWVKNPAAIIHLVDLVE